MFGQAHSNDERKMALALILRFILDSRFDMCNDVYLSKI